jgi:hypothetical protein
LEAAANEDPRGTGYLSLGFSLMPGESWYGTLSVEALSSGFSGKTHVWINTDFVRDFANALTAYPIAADRPITLGRSGVPFDDRDESVSISVRLFGPLGQVSILVDMSASLLRGRTPERTPRRLKLDVLTTYERLGRFSDDLLKNLDTDSHGPAARVDEEILIG